jgi:hypothetical protein
MTDSNFLSLLQTTEDPVPVSEYKANVRHAVKLLVSLGIREGNSSNLLASVKTVIEKLEKDEEALYGKKLNKKELQEELSELVKQLAASKEELAITEKELAIREEELNKLKNTYS